MRIFRSISEPLRVAPSFDERWNGHDEGLINCWEVGRRKREIDSALVEKCENNELPALGWKGGVDKKLKLKEKYGSLNYLAQWQGISGKDLDVSLLEEFTLMCSKTKILVTYTRDAAKLSTS